MDSQRPTFNKLTHKTYLGYNTYFSSFLLPSPRTVNKYIIKTNVRKHKIHRRNLATHLNNSNEKKYMRHTASIEGTLRHTLIIIMKRTIRTQVHRNLQNSLLDRPKWMTFLNFLPKMMKPCPLLGTITNSNPDNHNPISTSISSRFSL